MRQTDAMDAEPALALIRELCLKQPGAYEKLSHGSPCFFIEKGRQFAAFLNDHHGDGRLAAWLLARPGVQEMLIEADADIYFRPPYVGPKGWVGVWLDRDLDLDTFSSYIEEAAALGAPSSKSKTR